MHTKHHKRTVAIVYSKPTEEMSASSFAAADDDTELSAQQVKEALDIRGYDSYLFPVTTQTISSISSIKADCIFNLIEWSGKDMQCALDAMHLIEQTGIPFTGASVQNYTISSDKKIMKELFDKNNVPTPAWQTFETGDESISTQFRYPVIIKLEKEHCSIGLTKDAIADDEEDLKKKVKTTIKKFKQPILVEEYIEGRELHVTVLETEQGLTVLPPCEIVFKTQGKQAFLTYESRWDENHEDYRQSYLEMPKLSPKLLHHIEDVCTRMFKTLGYSDYTRVDMRLDKNDNVYVLEANANPGLGDEDEYAMTLSYREVGMKFDDIIVGIVESALRRFHTKG